MKIAYKRKDGALLIQDKTSSDGTIWGHVELPNGYKSPQQPMISIVAHGYWEEYKEN